MGVRFFVDNNFGENLVRGLKDLGYTNIEHLKETFKEDEEDVVWLRYVGENQLALITRDKNIRKNPKEKAALRKYKVVAFYLSGSERSIRDISKQLINAWNKMEDKAKVQFKKEVAGAFRVKPKGGSIEDIPLT
jgi:predicted nuclease of predicted toxin-antitoxin system